MRRNWQIKLLAIALLFSLLLVTGCTKQVFKFDIPESEIPTITVLAYHRILDGGPSFIDVSTSMFDNHLTWLEQNGYNVISYDEFIDFLDGKGNLPEKPVLITFDAGYKETYTNAMPILAKHEMPAVLFIYSNRMKDYSFDGGLSVTELREMQRKGWSIQAHTVTHADLSLFSPHAKASAMYEMAQNKKDIESKLGTEVTGLAYPYGAYTPEVEQWAQEAGFKAAFLIEEGPNTYDDIHPYRIKRHMLYQKDTLEDFARKVTSSPLQVIRTVPEQAQVIDYRPATVIADVVLPEGVKVVKVYADIESEDLSARFDAEKQRVIVDTASVGRGHHNMTIKLLGSDGRTYVYGWSYVIQ